MAPTALYENCLFQSCWPQISLAETPRFPLLALPEPLPHGVSTSQLPHSHPSHLLQDSPSLSSIASCCAHALKLWALRCFYDNIQSSLPTFGVLHDLKPASKFPPSASLRYHPHSPLFLPVLQKQTFCIQLLPVFSRFTSNHMFKCYHLPWPFWFTVIFLLPLNTLRKKKRVP